jgi:hypothetical protein
MQYDFLRRVLQKLKGFEKNRKSLYFRLKNYPNKSIFKDNLIFTDNLNKAVVSFAVEIFPKKDAVQKTRCFTYRTTPASTRCVQPRCPSSTNRHDWAPQARKILGVFLLLFSNWDFLPIDDPAKSRLLF